MRLKKIQNTFLKFLSLRINSSMDYTKQVYCIMMNFIYFENARGKRELFVLRLLKNKMNLTNYTEIYMTHHKFKVITYLNILMVNHNLLNLFII